MLSQNFKGSHAASRVGWIAALSLLTLALLSLPASAQSYQWTSLTSDIPGISDFNDTNLVNAWGLVASPTGPWWVSDNGTGLSTLYDGTGSPQSLVVTIPSGNGVDTGTPTGLVFNGTGDFKIFGTSALFIFATEDGTVSGWYGGLTQSEIAVNNSASGAVYKGIALASSGGNNYLYVANFHDNRIEVYDKNFASHSFGAGAFVDSTIPMGFAPFNVQAIGSNLYVTYAKQNAERHDDVAGPGNGYVDVYTTDGTLVRRLQHVIQMNSPWAVVTAASDFGPFSNDILVGQFGSGAIAAFDPNNGSYIGMMFDQSRLPLRINGLWGLNFGNGHTAGPTNTLYFTAGYFDEAHGILGTITPLSIGCQVNPVCTQGQHRVKK